MLLTAVLASRKLGHATPSTTLHHMAGFPDCDRSNQLVIKALQTLLSDVTTFQGVSKES